MEKMKFTELPLSGHILSAVADMGFEEASPIQAETIPILLEGRDIVGQAQTGTGKTAAFAIPVIENLEPGSRELQAIVLCPTRELVIQVTEEFHKLMKYMGEPSAVPVYGGQEIDRQFKALRKKPRIIIGTPGRMMDHIRRGTIVMDTVKIVVLDEADEMLDMGFREDIEIILKDTPKDRQTIMFSATMSRDILNLTKNYQNNPVKIDVTSQKIMVPQIKQLYYELPEKSKPEAVARLIDFHDIKLALVFCNTKNKVDTLVEILKTRGYFAEGLHGDLSQRQRDKVMAGFRSGSVEILVATDVAGRGIDVNDINAVFNYDLPRDDEDYIHRIGRTGRAGKSGTAFTFVTGREVYNLKRIERTNNTKITREQIPTIDDLDSTMLKTYGNRIKAIMEKGTTSKYLHLVESLMGDEYTSLDIAAALMNIMVDEKNTGYDESQKFDYSARQDFGDSRDSRESRDSRDSRDNRYSRDSRDSRDNRYSRDSRDSRRNSAPGQDGKAPYKSRPKRPANSGKPAYTPSSGGGFARKIKPRSSENSSRPAESRGRPAENRGRPAENRGRPAENRGRPAESRGRPAEKKARPLEWKR